MNTSVAEAAIELYDTLSERATTGGYAKVFFGEKYVYKVTEKKVMEKSSRVHNILSSSGDTSIGQYVPKTVLFKDLGEQSLVVEDRMQGIHPETIDVVLLKQVVQVLRAVHEIAIGQVLTNFEGDELPAGNYWQNQVEQSQRYKNKLVQSGTLTPEDEVLVNDAVAVVDEICHKKHTPPELVLVYKDVRPMNILVNSNGELKAIVDWDAAMSGPVELEYAVLWYRYHDMRQSIRPEHLDKDTFVVAGLVQGLRFWKSFTKDSPYVQQQRDALQKTLSLHRDDRDNWMDSL